MALKDYYDGECARILGELVRAQAHEFDVEGYVADTNTRVGPLELKDRVLVLAEGLRDRLDPDYETAVDTLVRALPEEIGDGEGMFGWQRRARKRACARECKPRQQKALFPMIGPCVHHMLRLRFVY